MVLFKCFWDVKHSCIKFWRSSTSMYSEQFSYMAVNLFCQCSIPVFDGLLPAPHNKILMNLLFTMSHWHRLAKLCMHSDMTLEIFDQQTTHLGKQFHHQGKDIHSYQTQELNCEVSAQSRCQAKDAARCKRNCLGWANEDNNTKGKGKAIEQF